MQRFKELLEKLGYRVLEEIEKDGVKIVRIFPRETNVTITMSIKKTEPLCFKHEKQPGSAKCTFQCGECIALQAKLLEQAYNCDHQFLETDHVGVLRCHRCGVPEFTVLDIDSTNAVIHPDYIEPRKRTVCYTGAKICENNELGDCKCEWDDFEKGKVVKDNLLNSIVGSDKDKPNTDVKMLTTLAEWFDKYDITFNRVGQDEVQQDLKRIAQRLIMLEGIDKLLPQLETRFATLVGNLDAAKTIIKDQHQLIGRLISERDKLKDFKEYTHKRLDAAGIPTDPDSPHKAAGCRIGGRLDVVLGQIQDYKEKYEEALSEAQVLRDELNRND